MFPGNIRNHQFGSRIMNHNHFAGFPPTQAFESSVTGEEIPRHHPPMPPPPFPPRHPASRFPVRHNVDDGFNSAYSFECRHLRSNGAWTAHEDQNARYRQNSISASNAHEQKNKVCWMFYGGEVCSFGDKCSYLHVEPASHQDNPGDYSRQISIYWKTKLCYRWSSSGQCPYGDQCSYAHGVAELRKPRDELYIKNVAAVPPKVDPSLAIDVLANSKTEMRSLPGAHPKIRALTLEKSKRIYGDWIDDF